MADSESGDMPRADGQFLRDARALRSRRSLRGVRPAAHRGRTGFRRAATDSFGPLELADLTLQGASLDTDWRAVSASASRRRWSVRRRRRTWSPCPRRRCPSRPLWAGAAVLRSAARAARTTTSCRSTRLRAIRSRTHHVIRSRVATNLSGPLLPLAVGQRAFLPFVAALMVAVSSGVARCRSTSFVVGGRASSYRTRP